MTPLLRQYLAPYRRELVIVSVLLLAQAVGSLYLPALNAALINNGVVTGDLGYVVEVGGIMLVVTLLLGVTAVVSTWYSSRTAMAFGRDLRGSLFRTVQTFSRREVNQFGAPSLITRTTNDVQQMQTLVLTGLTVMLTAPLVCIGGIVMALRQDVVLSGLLLIIVPLMAILVALVITRAIPLFRSIQGKIDRVNQVLREQLAGARVIRAFVRTEHEQVRFAQANSDLTETSLQVNRVLAVMPALMMLILNLSSAAVIWFGGIRVDAGQMPIGNLTAFLTYLIQILFAVLMATMVFVMIPRAMASAERISAVLQTAPEMTDPVTPRLVPRGGRLQLRDVSFAYPGAQEPVLQGVSFEAGPGETTAIVGSTGSGKTTLISLVPRLFDVTGGAVLIDGVDVREQSRDAIWARIGLVPQKAFLFTGTIADNLRFGNPEATETDMWRALETAQAADFVRLMSEGLQSRIDQAGMNLSGGQRQRLSIARALIRRPEIYVFDDSFSALDFATDARLRAALSAETAEATVLVVAQRVATIRNADRIVVLDGGRVAGIGTHGELMRDCETYREIVLSQLTEEEAA